MTLSAWWRSKGPKLAAPVAPPVTFCAHQYHCRECHDILVKLAQSWMTKVAALERELAAARTL